MYYFRSYIVGGYAYYRSKSFGHSGAVSMVLLSSLGFVFLILHGVLNANDVSFFSDVSVTIPYIDHILREFSLFNRSYSLGGKSFSDSCGRS